MISAFHVPWGTFEFPRVHRALCAMHPGELSSPGRGPGICSMFLFTSVDPMGIPSVFNPFLCPCLPAVCRLRVRFKRYFFYFAYKTYMMKSSISGIL